MYLVRKAELHDAPIIHQLVLPHVYSPTNPQAEQTGFIIWPQSIEAYQQRIKRSPYVAVAEQEAELVGFAVTYQLDVLQQMTDDIPHEDKIIPYLLSHYSLDSLFIDQICIKKGFQGKGIARLLERWLTSQLPDCTMIALIVHLPVKNQASIRFFTSCGFSLAQEIVQNNYKLGIYERKAPA